MSGQGQTVEAEERCGWMKRFDELQAEMAANGGRMPGPWRWEIQDASMAVLCGGGEDAITGHIMSVGPCEACYRDKDEWLWGRCCTPSAEHARLIAAAPDMLAALKTIGALVSERFQTGKASPRDDELWAAYSHVIAAITKAEGRS